MSLVVTMHSCSADCAPHQSLTRLEPDHELANEGCCLASQRDMAGLAGFDSDSSVSANRSVATKLSCAGYQVYKRSIPRYIWLSGCHRLIPVWLLAQRLKETMVEVAHLIIILTKSFAVILFVYATWQHCSLEVHVGERRRRQTALAQGGYAYNAIFLSRPFLQVECRTCQWHLLVAGYFWKLERRASSSLSP